MRQIKLTAGLLATDDGSPIQGAHQFRSIRNPSKGASARLAGTSRRLPYGLLWFRTSLKGVLALNPAACFVLPVDGEDRRHEQGHLCLLTASKNLA